MHHYAHINPDKPTIVLVDTSVLLHKLDQQIGVDHKDKQFEPLLKANLAHVNSCQWLPERVRDTVRGCIYTLDLKQDLKYWRHDYLLNHVHYLAVPRKTKIAEKVRAEAMELYFNTGEVTAEQHERLAICYKAGRKLPTSRFKKVKRLIYKWLEGGELGAPAIGKPYYESDDIQATICKLNADSGHPVNIVLYTVDSDLMGLIDPSVTWICQTGFNPPIRDSLAVCNSWAERRLGVELERYSDIWVVKSHQGDKSDGLPPSNGVLLPVINLYNPPEKHRLWDDATFTKGLKATLNNAIMQKVPSDRSALDWLYRSGHSPVVADYSKV